MEKNTQKKTPKDLWKNRRKMAWRAFYAGVAYITFISIFVSIASIERIKSWTELGSFSLSVFGFLGAIIAAYIGASTYHDVKLGSRQEDEN